MPPTTPQPASPAPPPDPSVTAPSLVSIVGRPNVGKSALFNRIVGSRRAIVEDLPGTTRDRLEAPVTWNKVTFRLVDTGGLQPGSKEPLAQLVHDQALTAMREAHLILFIVDGKQGITALDEEVADLLRQATAPVLLVANKVDNVQREWGTTEFFALGLGDPRLVSAYHGSGVGDLLDEVAALLPICAVRDVDATHALGIAIVGRPNVGKSMLLNRLLGLPRVLVSETPGTTRDAIDTPLHFQEREYLLIDTAGIRRPGNVEHGVEQYSVLRALDAIHKADVALLVIDAQEGLVAQDLHIAGYAKEAYKGFAVLSNKWDLVGGDRRAMEEHLRRDIRDRFRYAHDTPLLCISALTGDGVDSVLPTATALGDEASRRVPTSALNQILSEALQSHPPPRKGKRTLKLFYVTQTGILPPAFVLFVNDPSLIHFSYERYLANQIRAGFGFAHIPIRLVFRARTSLDRPSGQGEKVSLAPRGTE